MISHSIEYCIRTPEASDKLRFHTIISQNGTDHGSQKYNFEPCLTSIVEALEHFQNFEPPVRAVAIALYASELGVAQMHFYAIALHTGLGVEG